MKPSKPSTEQGRTSRCVSSHHNNTGQATLRAVMMMGVAADYCEQNLCTKCQLHSRLPVGPFRRLMTVICSTPCDPTLGLVTNSPGNDRIAVCLQRASAEAVLKELQAQPDAWTKVDTILESSSTEQTKFFALQVPAACSCYSPAACAHTYLTQLYVYLL